MRTAVVSGDPKLTRIAAALRETFGVRLVSALLFGSRARGDHRPDSDYDVAVLLEDFDRERDRELFERIRKELGEEIWTLQFWPLAKDGLAERTTLTFNIRNEAVPLPGLGWPPIVAPPIAPEEGEMKPETKVLLDASERELARARKMISVHELEAAARDGYYAVLFAARAMIFELKNLAPKTHSGAASLFAESAVKPGLMEPHHSATLSQGLDIRIDVDYAALPKTSAADAVTYVERAADFVGAVKQVLEHR